MGYIESHGLGFFGNQLCDLGVVQFADLPAFSADEKLADMLAIGFAAPDKGIQGFDLVNKTVFDQEFQCAVDRRRRGGTVSVTHIVENVIGPDGGVAAPDDFENLPTQWGKPQPVLTTRLFRRIEGICNTHRVVVLPVREGGFRLLLRHCIRSAVSV